MKKCLVHITHANTEWHVHSLDVFDAADLFDPLNPAHITALYQHQTLSLNENELLHVIDAQDFREQWLIALSQLFTHNAFLTITQQLQLFTPVLTEPPATFVAEYPEKIKRILEDFLRCWMPPC
jgi:hypothetical protein